MLIARDRLATGDKLMSDKEQEIHRYRLKLPRHVCIIMDGNGRWAEQRGKMRIAGHKAGVETVRNIVEAAGELGIEVLTLFAFSSENWRRPPQEVGMLMELFLTALSREARKLHRNNVRLRVIGDISAFEPKLQNSIDEAQTMTCDNTGLTLVIAANYGGRWDVTQAVRSLAQDVAAGTLDPTAIDEAMIQSRLCVRDLPEPDLFIRTGGEQRISNFLLWQLSYSELYFTETLWPDFDKPAFMAALESFTGRQRRFGRTGNQVEQLTRA